jgi:hypothetical protein
VLGGPTVVVGEVRVDEMVLHAMVAAHAEDLAAHP